MYQKVIGLAIRFVVGILLFQWSHPIVAEIIGSTLATTLVAGVLVGLGIWSFVKLPF